MLIPSFVVVISFPDALHIRANVDYPLKLSPDAPRMCPALPWAFCLGAELLAYDNYSLQSWLYLAQTYRHLLYIVKDFLPTHLPGGVTLKHSTPKRYPHLRSSSQPEEIGILLNRWPALRHRYVTYESIEDLASSGGNFVRITHEKISVEARFTWTLICDDDGFSIRRNPALSNRRGSICSDK